MAGQDWNMIETGRQTAPPQLEVVLVTSRALDPLQEASLHGSEPSVPPRLPAVSCREVRRRRADVCAVRTLKAERQMLLTAASAPDSRPTPGERG